MRLRERRQVEIFKYLITNITNKCNSKIFVKERFDYVSGKNDYDN